MWQQVCQSDLTSDHLEIWPIWHQWYFWFKLMYLTVMLSHCKVLHPGRFLSFWHISDMHYKSFAIVRYALVWSLPYDCNLHSYNHSLWPGLSLAVTYESLIVLANAIMIVNYYCAVITIVNYYCKNFIVQTTENFQGANTLAYFDASSTTKKKFYSIDTKVVHDRFNQVLITF